MASSSAPPSRKEQTHDRIVETASRAIRRSGFQGVGVADIMKQAGLTHGGFYAHFASRDALLCEALAHAGRRGSALLAEVQRDDPADGRSPFRRLVESYLSARTLASAESGCAVAALASEMPRQADAVREAAAQRVRGLVDMVRQALPASAAPEAAGVVAGQLVGALQLARALGNTDEGLAFLADTRRALLAQHDAPVPVSST